jgi:hypothetical protein
MSDVYSINFYKNKSAEEDFNLTFLKAHSNNALYTS